MLVNVSAAARLRCNLGNEPVSRAHDETFLSRTAKTVRGPAMAHTITRRITCWLLIVLGAYLDDVGTVALARRTRGLGTELSIDRPPATVRHFRGRRLHSSRGLLSRRNQEPRLACQFCAQSVYTLRDSGNPAAVLRTGLGSHLIQHEQGNPDGVLGLDDLVGALRRTCYQDRGPVYASTLHRLENAGKLPSLQKLVGAGPDGLGIASASIRR